MMVAVTDREDTFLTESEFDGFIGKWSKISEVWLMSWDLYLLSWLSLICSVSRLSWDKQLCSSCPLCHDALASDQIQISGVTRDWNCESYKSSLLWVIHICPRDERRPTQRTYIPTILFSFRQSLTHYWVNHTQFLNRPFYASCDEPPPPRASKLLPLIGPESYKGCPYRRSSWHKTWSVLSGMLFLCPQNLFRATPGAALSLKSCVFPESFTLGEIPKSHAPIKRLPRNCQ